MTVDVIICCVSCLLHLFFSVVEHCILSRKLKVICSECGAVNEVEKNELLNDEQIRYLMAFLASVRGVRNDKS